VAHPWGRREMLWWRSRISWLSGARSERAGRTGARGSRSLFRPMPDDAREMMPPSVTGVIPARGHATLPRCWPEGRRRGGATWLTSCTGASLGSGRRQSCKCPFHRTGIGPQARCAATSLVPLTRPRRPPARRTGSSGAARRALRRSHSETSTPNGATSAANWRLRGTDPLAQRDPRHRRALVCRGIPNGARSPRQLRQRLPQPARRVRGLVARRSASRRPPLHPAHFRSDRGATL
jgi:hypothetical protein